MRKKVNIFLSTPGPAQPCGLHCSMETAGEEDYGLCVLWPQGKRAAAEEVRSPGTKSLEVTITNVSSLSRGQGHEESGKCLPELGSRGGAVTQHPCHPRPHFSNVDLPQAVWTALSACALGSQPLPSSGKGGGVPPLLHMREWGPHRGTASPLGLRSLRERGRGAPW